MAINPSGAVAVPLTVYGSWVTEVSPNAVPENISPDCGDVVFAPGSVGSRPALQRVLGSPFPAEGSLIPTVTYMKSFKLPTGQIKNLYLDSSGALWVEDLTNHPGAFTLLFQSTAGNYARSCTAFGREYLAISDGLHGSDVPLQYDGQFLDRFTADAPGAPPVINSVSYPPVNVAAGSPRTDTIVNAFTSGLVNTHYTTLVFDLTAPDASLAIGQSVTVSGNTNGFINGTWKVAYVYPGNQQFYASVFFSANETGTGGSAVFSGTTLTRQNNLVTAITATAHNLQVGYQALLQNNGSLAVGGGIASIVIDNETNPGLALVTTNAAHTLKPQNDVTITGVAPKMIGTTGSWSATYNGDNVTLTYSGGAHGLVPGAVIQVTDVAVDVFQTTATVALVPAPNQVSYFQAPLTDTASLPLTNAAVSVAITWPIPDNTPTPTYFEVQTCPTATSFTVQVTYTDGTWTSGVVGFPWDGTFYVQSVPSATKFTYQQYGPDGATTETSGTVTPWGQCAPGLHLVAVCYLDRQGGITAPSPFATFISNGGQYINLTNIPLGPPSCVARILVFTGAQPNVPGELPPFFYIPAIPQLEGQIVGTSTQINDNVTTSVLLDFADNTLFAAIGISIPGNDLANQITLDGALGFGQYLSRLTTWGQRNTINNLLNMGFDGGTQPSVPNFPSGWNKTINTQVSTLINAPSGVGVAWQINIDTTGTRYGEIQQSAYIDAYGDPIVLPNETYIARIQAMGNGGTIGGGLEQIQFVISSFSTGFASTAAIPLATLTTSMQFFTAAFDTPMPASVPTDMVLKINVQGSSPNGLVVTLDNASIIYAKTPFLDQIAFASYINNPAGIDGTSGQFGADDPAKLMDMGELRGTLNLLTQAPTGRLHETDGSASSEPSGWVVNEVAANCGTLSAFGLTLSQADDTAASGGEEWFAWPSESGAEIFGGGQPEKISQEIQPNWYDPSRSDTTIQINMTSALTAWALNDPVQRLLMFGLPIGSATAPSKVYVLNYRNLGSAQAIAGSPPFHPSFAGKLIATDNSRKWAPWNMTINCAARMYRSTGALTLILGDGNGHYPATTFPTEFNGTGNVYSLNPAKYTDDDFGQIHPYYTTYFFIDPEKAMALGLKGQRILMGYLMAYIQGIGQLTATYYPDDLANPWSLTTTRTLTTGFFDREFGGGMCTGNRIAVKFASAPITGTDNSFVMSRLTAFIKDAKMKIRGSNQ